MTKRSLSLGASLLICALATSAPAKPQKYKKRTKIDFSDVTISGELVGPQGAYLSATPGGAQDIAHARHSVAAGRIPRPESFTAAGLFSRHDLGPKERPACHQLLCVFGQAQQLQLTPLPKVRYLARLAFSSGLRRDTFKRPPLNLVAVIDTSGSMNGAPLHLAKTALLQIVSMLGEGDRLTLVSYAAGVHTRLRPTAFSAPGARQRIELAINSLKAGGSTAMEAGLKQGFQLARRHSDFNGANRVILFTDERPNVGRTDAASFMAMAQAASKRSVGLTTIGVGQHFDPALANKVSSVRGGNLFYFSEPSDIKERILDSFDSMVTELAYDMRLRFSPGPGLKIAGVFGIPEERLSYDEDGSISLTVQTLFLSKKRGAIFVALSPSAGLPAPALLQGATVAEASLHYTLRSGVRKRDYAGLPMTRSSDLNRGAHLIDQHLSTHAAAEIFHAGDPKTAYRLVSDLAGRFEAIRDPALKKEQELIRKLEALLANAAGIIEERPIANNR